MEEQTDKGTAKKRIDFLSEVFRLLREALLVIVLLLLFLWPSTINSVLQSAGFTEADFGWVKWEIQESAEETAEAMGTVDLLRGQIDTLRTQLQAVPLESLSDTVREQVESVVNGFQAIEKSTEEVDQSLERSFEKNRVLLEQVQTIPTVSSERLQVRPSRLDTGVQQVAPSLRERR